MKSLIGVQLCVITTSQCINTWIVEMNPLLNSNLKYLAYNALLGAQCGLIVIQSDLIGIQILKILAFEV